MNDGIAQLRLEYSTKVSSEQAFIMANETAEDFESKLKMQLKVYNGAYIDNWIMINFTMDTISIIENLAIGDEILYINGSVSARVSLGKYFDMLIDRPCKIDKLLIRSSKD